MLLVQIYLKVAILYLPYKSTPSFDHKKIILKTRLIDHNIRYFMSAADGQMTHWAEYLKQLFKVNPPSRQLQTTSLQMVDVDPPINETAPSLDEVKETVTRLRGGKAAGICNISAELLKAGGRWVAGGIDCCKAFRYHSS